MTRSRRTASSDAGLENASRRTPFGSGGGGAAAAWAAPRAPRPPRPAPAPSPPLPAPPAPAPGPPPSPAIAGTAASARLGQDGFNRQVQQLPRGLDGRADRDQRAAAADPLGELRPAGLADAVRPFPLLPVPLGTEPV